MSNLIRDLEKMVQIHGSAKVAVALGFRDARTVQMWIKRKSIPKCRLSLVEYMLKKHKTPKIIRRPRAGN